MISPAETPGRIRTPHGVATTHLVERTRIGFDRDRPVVQTETPWVVIATDARIGLAE